MVPVTTGVPQGSILGPILFLAYINDIPDKVTSQARLFADDTAMYLTMEGAKNSSVLQQDLDRLSVWESDWHMEFNPSKVAQVAGSRKPVSATYVLHGVVLETVTCARYLGVDISINFSWGSHIDRITGTAHKTLGFVQRNISRKMSGVREAAFTTLVRPQLEYAAAIWDPHHKDKKDPKCRFFNVLSAILNYFNLSSLTPLLSYFSLTIMLLLDLSINILGLLDSATCLECPRGRMVLCKEWKERKDIKIIIEQPYFMIIYIKQMEEKTWCEALQSILFPPPPLMF